MLRRKVICLPCSFVQKLNFFQSFVHILVKSNERGGQDETMTTTIL